MNKDNLDRAFSGEITKPSDFKFGATVANAFDDMVERPVPPDSLQSICFCL